jgi:hypothetical protein
VSAYPPRPQRPISNHLALFGRKPSSRAGKIENRLCDTARHWSSQARMAAAEMAKEHTLGYTVTRTVTGILELENRCTGNCT